jgi:hypothetical protein
MMPRHSLGAKAPSGESRVIRCKISEAEEQAAKAAVKEGETLSELMRLALAKEVKSREKAASRSR